MPTVSPHRIVATMLMVALLLSVPLARMGASAQESDDPNAPSPAEDHAEVIAQGIGAIPAEQVAWRLVEDTAEPVGEADFEERALGFAVATEDALLLADEADGARTRLGRGEAAFVAEGITQRRESLGEGSSPYWRIALLAAEEAQEANGDTLVYGGDAFAAPAGDHDLDLVAAKLAVDESTTVESGFPILVVVADGTASVAAVEGGEALELTQGEAATVDGTVELTATEDGTRVLVAVIGASIAAEGTESGITPVADGEDTESGTGRIILLSASCPVGVTAEEAGDTTAGDPCFGGEPVGGMTVTVENLETGEAASEEIDPASGSAGFADLPAGTYNVVFDAGEGFGETVGTCGGQDSSADLPVVSFAGSSVDLELPAEREYLCVTRTMTLGDDSGGDDAGDDDVAEFGSIGVTFYACPSGMTYATLDSSQCELITEGFDFGFQGDVDVHLADAGVSGGGYVWHEFPLDNGTSWSPVVYAYPDGYSWYAISSDGGEPLEPHAGGYLLTSDQPIHILQVYFLES
jgi:hypothetical protein